MCYGDGNTHGRCASADPSMRKRFRRHVRWTGRVATALRGEARVIAEGLPGRTTMHDDPVEGAYVNGLTFLPAVLQSHQPIDIVVLMLGTEDLKTRFSLTPADIARALERLVETIERSAAGPGGDAPRVLLMAPAPILEAWALGGHFIGGAELSEHLSAHCDLLAERRGCGFLDAGAVAQVDPLDGVHLTEAGHAALADAVEAKLAAMVADLTPGRPARPRRFPLPRAVRRG